MQQSLLLTRKRWAVSKLHCYAHFILHVLCILICATSMENAHCRFLHMCFGLQTNIFSFSTTLESRLAPFASYPYNNSIRSSRLRNGGLIYEKDLILTAPYSECSNHHTALSQDRDSELPKTTQKIKCVSFLQELISIFFI